MWIRLALVGYTSQFCRGYAVDHMGGCMGATGIRHKGGGGVGWDGGLCWWGQFTHLSCSVHTNQQEKALSLLDFSNIYWDFGIFLGKI